jgi:hypothetical protein
MPTDPTSKSILNFVLPGQLNVAPMIDHGEGDADGEITVLMPIGAPLTGIVPTTIIHTGKSVPNANVPKNFDNPADPVSYTVEAGNGTEKTYTVRITHPVLPPLTSGSHDGYEFAVTLGPDGIHSGNIYNIFDNNLNTLLCFNNYGTVTVTWASGAQAVNCIRVFLPNATAVCVQFKTPDGSWVEVIPTTQYVAGEFVQQIPASMDITGVQVTVSQGVAYQGLRPRISEFIIE